jgi:hypothetical protein
MGADPAKPPRFFQQVGKIGAVPLLGRESRPGPDFRAGPPDAPCKGLVERGLRCIEERRADQGVSLAISASSSLLSRRSLLLAS